MTLEELIRSAAEQRATDVHLEPFAPVTLRIQSELKRVSQAVDSATLKTFARGLLKGGDWDAFLKRGSADICRSIVGVRCRINILRDDRGIGFAIRLLSRSATTLRTCNLHPSFKDLIQHEHGLIILTGPTGSGKSTTLAALVDEINANESRHIITLESPIEYRHQSRKSLVRQREVGAHTPSYEQGLLDALREDPDVLIVGEMREPEAMRLTLNAAETGHLVLATMHSASAMDAIYRIMMSFPPERQSSVLAQIADTLVAVVSQKLKFRESENLLVPVCEVLTGTYSARNVIRKGDISKLPSILQTGGSEGMITFERYAAWLDEKTDWCSPEPPGPEDLATEEAENFRESDDDGFEHAVETVEVDEEPEVTRPQRKAARRAEPRVEIDVEAAPSTQPASPRSLKSKANGSSKMKIHKDGRIEIPELDVDLNEIVKEFKSRGEG